jgi:hypothetical protein
MSFERQQDDTEYITEKKKFFKRKKYFIHTAIFEKVVPIAVKNIRGCRSNIL